MTPVPYETERAEAAPRHEAAALPERASPDPGPGRLSFRDWRGAFVHAAKGMLDDNMLMFASALAYSTFFAVPSVLLVVVGVFSLVAGPTTITTVIDHVGRIVPHQATQLLDSSLQRLGRHPAQGIAMTAVGAVLALWTTTSAMTSYMTALNLAYGRKDKRGFVRKRLVAISMAACIGLAFLLVALLLVFGGPLEGWVGRAIGMQSLVSWLWWSVQWPILIVALLTAFATMLWLGPDGELRSWRFMSPGSVVAVGMWLVVSGVFAYYTSHFGSYNKTWGSLSAVIVMLTWLWLTSLALLYGAELNAAIERRRGTPYAGRQPAPE
ncbi:MAG TPA: YihY/virulence factor BrkB family protein [Gaiellaceae bacterium]|jgi:membrane protein|nr:YihY/virulence factor BrkB family protein [Gaiellaceae bacterium]